MNKTVDILEKNLLHNEKNPLHNEKNPLHNEKIEFNNNNNNNNKNNNNNNKNNNNNNKNNNNNNNNNNNKKINKTINIGKKNINNNKKNIIFENYNEKTKNQKSKYQSLKKISPKNTIDKIYTSIKINSKPELISLLKNMKNNKYNASNHFLNKIQEPSIKIVKNNKLNYKDDVDYVLLYINNIDKIRNDLQTLFSILYDIHENIKSIKNKLNNKNMKKFFTKVLKKGNNKNNKNKKDEYLNVLINLKNSKINILMLIRDYIKKHYVKVLENISNKFDNKIKILEEEQSIELDKFKKKI